MQTLWYNLVALSDFLYIILHYVREKNTLFYLWLIRLIVTLGELEYKNDIFNTVTSKHSVAAFLLPTF